MPKVVPWLPGETPEDDLIASVMGMMSAHPEDFPAILDRDTWASYIEEMVAPELGRDSEWARFYADRTADLLPRMGDAYFAAGMYSPTPAMVARHTFVGRDVTTGRFLSYGETGRLLKAARRYITPGW